MRDWNDKFANSADIPGSENLHGLWAAQAVAFRRKAAVEEDIPYGPLPRQKLDLVRPKGPGKGLVILVHGGFWIRCAKFDWPDLAQGARANG
ncbi:hypothetical protein GCM10011402_32310 [Paracoccus acridae]|uniref:Alpha/beta hydrolase n=1 Tax=Paracoccus acridae TaxID=1795310 RepID=A0ABQ1VL02_9RHOB|nr:hypothetical protein [Paracoccus acridae]GGF77219.1 hypothetical protein GCM10011402_32310 [Paracoccus acridae]